MFDTQALVLLSKQNQKTIVVAVRLAAALAEKGRALSRNEAASLCKVSELVFEEVRKDLEPYFAIHGGRISFKDKDSLPPPWEMNDPKTDQKVDKHLESLAKKKNLLQSDTPKAIVLRAMIAIGIDEKQVERNYHWLARAHGHERLVRAVERAKEVHPADPIPFLLSWLKRNAATADQATTGKARTVFKFVKPANPEAAKTEFVGWEAPPEGCDPANPQVIRPAGQPRRIYRQRTGHIRLELPPPGTRIPTPQEDFGVLVR